MTQDKNQLFAHLSHKASFVLMDSDVPFVNWQVCFQHHCECVSVCVGRVVCLLVLPVLGFKHACEFILSFLTGDS